MNLKMIVPVILTGIGFVVWANYDREDNSKYAVREVPAAKEKLPELEKVLRATLELHRKKRTGTLENIFSDTREKRSVLRGLGESDPFRESMEVLDRHSGSLDLNAVQYLQLAQKKNCYRVVVNSANGSRICFSYRKSRDGYRIVNIAEL